MVKKEEKKKIQLQIAPKKKDRKKMIIATIILVVLLLVSGQYVATKYQMSIYDINDYACVHMSYDAEKFFEDLGFNTVQRRVEAEHRWIAVEILPNIFIEYESTLRIFGLHLVTDDMMGKTIYQSDGFWKEGEQIVSVETHQEIHKDLDDWQAIGNETGPPNQSFWENLP